MKKAGLLQSKPLMATNGMIAAAKRDKGTVRVAQYGCMSRKYIEYGTRHYFRAQRAGEGVLEVDMFARRELAERKRDPCFRIFLNYEGGDFISWNMAEEKWSRAKIDMLDAGDAAYCYQYRGRNIAPKSAAALVKRCLNTGAVPDVETAVLEFQLSVRSGELKKKHRLITDMIDGHMDTVPDKLPADWMGFINRKALEKGHCILFVRGEKSGYCTCCRLHVPVPEEARHNAPGKCRCGCGITYKSWKKQKAISYSTAASIRMRRIRAFLQHRKPVHRHQYGIFKRRGKP